MWLMFFRVLERHAPSRLLTVLVAAPLTLTLGLKCGVTFLLGVASLELGYWLDNHGRDH